MNTSMNIQGDGFLKGRAWLTGSVAALGLVLPSMGLAVPLATTEVAKFCEVRGDGYAFDQQVNVQQTYAQSTACNLAVPASSASGYAIAEFGPGIPRVGTTIAGAVVSTYNAIAEANFAANTQYFFEIQQFATTPGPAPALFPVLFSAYGVGNSVREGYGISRSIGMAHLFGDPLDYDDALFEFYFEVVDETAYDPVDQESQGGGFDGTRYLNLNANYTYGVVISAACATWVAPVGQDASASAGCYSRVDPFIGFDQAAFDAQMGNDTFRLDDYFGFVYSANVAAAPIPEPGTTALMLVGVGLMGAVARRRKPAGH